MTSLAHDPLQQARERSMRYWMSDGIPLVALGGLWLIWAAVLLLPILFPSRIVVRIMSVAVMLALGGAGLFMNRAIRAWKERVTFPRTGYIELRPARRTRRAAVVAAALATAVVVFAVVYFSGPVSRLLREWVPLAFGLFLAAALLQVGWKMNSLRLSLLSALIAIAAVATFLFHLSVALSNGVIFLTAGLVCVADGLLVLRSYVRQHPLPSGDAE